MLFTKTTRIHSERILAVSPEILHTELDELTLLSTNVLRDVIVQFFPWYMTNIAEPKLANVTHWNRTLLKWTEEFYILLKILSYLLMRPAGKNPRVLQQKKVKAFLINFSQFNNKLVIVFTTNGVEHSVSLHYLTFCIVLWMLKNTFTTFPVFSSCSRV